MKYQAIDPQLFIRNRQKFASRMKPGSIALFHSNDEMPRNADAFFRFRQNSDLFYLSGIDQEDTVLVIFPDSPNPMFREMLFIKRTNETIAQWDGHKLTPEEALAASGVKNIFWYDEFQATIRPAILLAEQIYLNLNENDRFNDHAPYNALRFAQDIIRKFPLHATERSAPIMAALRTCKEEEEIELLREATRITGLGFRRLLGFVKPGVWEYEIEAELIHEFIRNRANGWAFDPIIASGASACVLHYVENNKQCKDGDLLLLDFGADYANYNGDLTRCIPVNGRFSERQKAVYNAVLHIQKESIKNLRAGLTLNEWFAMAGEMATEQLVNLGLLKMDDVKNQDPARPLYKTYFMHGLGHHLGIDVHDIMNRWARLENNNVITVEPGLYIPEWGIGVRSENDVVIRPEGNEDLMAGLPIEVEEIESLMNP
jgi:Xaa-Pro aminopeptidase